MSCDVTLLAATACASPGNHIQFLELVKSCQRQADNVLVGFHFSLHAETYAGRHVKIRISAVRQKVH
jgi:hypothetical protein